MLQLTEYEIHLLQKVSKLRFRNVDLKSAYFEITDKGLEYGPQYHLVLFNKVVENSKTILKAQFSAANKGEKKCSEKTNKTQT